MMIEMANTEIQNNNFTKLKRGLLVNIDEVTLRIKGVRYQFS